MKKILSLTTVLLVLSMPIYAQEEKTQTPEVASEAEKEPKVLLEGEIPEGEYEITQNNEVLINGVPFIQYSLAPKAKPGPVEENPTCAELQFNHSPTVDRILLSTNIAASAMAFYGMKEFKYDKTKHFLAGYVIGNMATGGFQLILPADMEHRKLVAALLGFGSGVLIGTAKEVRDAQGYGTPDVNDALVTFAGAGVGAMTMSFGDVKNAFRKKKPSKKINPTF
jgi:hypothetical protein